MKRLMFLIALGLIVTSNRGCLSPRDTTEEEDIAETRYEQTLEEIRKENMDQPAGSWLPWPNSRSRTGTGTVVGAPTGTGDIVTPATLTSTATPTEEILVAPIATGQWGEIFQVMSHSGVENGGRAPEFTLPLHGPAVCTVTKILTYHWNYGSGMTPGTIALQGSDGSYYGPYQASGEDGMGGVVNANWVVFVNIQIVQAVTYTVIDSDPGTWAQNDETGGEGITIVWGACRE